MFTRAGKELLSNSSNFTSTGEPWSRDGDDLVPSDPTDTVFNSSTLFFESAGVDMLLRQADSGVEDENFVKINATDITPKEI